MLQYAAFFPFNSLFLTSWLPLVVACSSQVARLMLIFSFFLSNPNRPLISNANGFWHVSCMLRWAAMSRKNNLFLRSQAVGRLHIQMSEDDFGDLRPLNSSERVPQTAWDEPHLMETAAAWPCIFDGVTTRRGSQRRARQAPRAPSNWQLVVRAGSQCPKYRRKVVGTLRVLVAFVPLNKRICHAWWEKQDCATPSDPRPYAVVGGRQRKCRRTGVTEPPSEFSVGHARSGCRMNPVWVSFTTGFSSPNILLRRKILCCFYLNKWKLIPIICSLDYDATTSVKTICAWGFLWFPSYSLIYFY